MLCSIDVNAASLIVPIAQATVISAPILLRDQLRRGASQVMARRRGDTLGAGQSVDPSDESVMVEEEPEG
jgi:hypothetical protein